MFVCSNQCRRQNYELCELFFFEWILPSGLATKRALIGGHKVSSGKWSWSDGTKWDFESWADGQPSDENGEEEEYYLELISPKDGQWNDVPLEYSNEHGYICQYKL